MEAFMQINGVKVQIGIELLERIASNLNDNEANQPIFHELAKSLSSAVRQEIAYKDKISEETASLLLADLDQKVLERIVRNDVARGCVETDRLSEIIDTAGEDVLKEIAYNLDSYENMPAEQVATNLLKRKNPAISLAVANNYSTPKKILKSLTKDADPDVSSAAKNSLS